ncbi:hypothetical protein [Urbifossiella limnaea]|uniref:Cytochrome c domain-containing protein n=1 Tax=Urbifossiella limnaea TaxID=2528023 RepID=A0A517Y0B4_9BACT|nr:hypothetical protein [Urbifossiella limnaea]QDU23200.1 hypothetical protein ETAA1_51920 [Urbifossiella limnaea]
MTAPVRIGLLAALAVLVGGAAPAAPEPAATEPTKQERASLAYLHRHTVKLFIDQSGFGFSRMEPPLTDVLGPPKSAADQPSGTAVGPQPDPIVIVAAKGAKGAKDERPAHFSFAKAAARGVVFFPPPAPKKAWVLKDVQLVGLVKNPEPVVYLTGGGMKTEKEVKTRRPDAFETRALEVIRGGGDLVQAEKANGAMRAVSGVYAGRQCLRCHERPGEMLGAFTYRLAVEDAPAAGTVRP